MKLLHTRRWLSLLTAAAATTTAAVLLASTPIAQAAPRSHAQVAVANCPVPALDYQGTHLRPHPAPATLSVPAYLKPPGNARLFGTDYVPFADAYLLGPASATCQARFASADGGEVMAATLGTRGDQGVLEILSPGGAGPSTDLACPYIPAVRAADEVFRMGNAECGHPGADVIRQIPTGTPNIYAALVLVPAHVKDPSIWGSGNGEEAVALFTAQVAPEHNQANGQAVVCTLGSAQRDTCVASVRFFLATQTQISTKLSAARLAAMETFVLAVLSQD
jgi:hypothetical protein